MEFAASLEQVQTSVIIKELYQLLIDSDQFKSLDEQLLMDILKKELDNLRNYVRNSEQSNGSSRFLEILMALLFIALGIK